MLIVRSIQTTASSPTSNRYGNRAVVQRPSPMPAAPHTQSIYLYHAKRHLTTYYRAPTQRSWLRVDMPGLLGEARSPTPPGAQNVHLIII